jgi:predicted phosphoribosyltransferase
MAFQDREDAGKRLAMALDSFKDKGVVVYAIPRGGVVLGAIIAKALNAPLDLIIVRKVGHPNNPEYAICVVSENNTRVCNEAETRQIDPKILGQAIDAERAEAKRRREVYLAGRLDISVEGKTAILVDDGIATGLTFLTALRELKKRNPKNIIAALPVMPADFETELTDEAVKLVVLEKPNDFLGSVGAYYQNFPQVSDEEVVKLLQGSEA